MRLRKERREDKLIVHSYLWSYIRNKFPKARFYKSSVMLIEREFDGYLKRKIDQMTEELEEIMHLNRRIIVNQEDVDYVMRKIKVDEA